MKKKCIQLFLAIVIGSCLLLLPLMNVSGSADQAQEAAKAASVNK